MEKFGWVVDVKCSEFEEPIPYTFNVVMEYTAEEMAQIAKDLADKDHPKAKHTVVGVARI